jgi:hypothetical protein
VFGKSQGAKLIYLLGSQLESTGNPGSELHVRDDVTLNGDARHNLDKLKPLRTQVKYSPLRNIEHQLSTSPCLRGAERDLINFIQELGKTTFPIDNELAILYPDVQSLGGEGTAENNGLSGLGDIHEPPWADQAVVKVADIDVALGINLGE